MVLFDVMMNRVPAQDASDAQRLVTNDRISSVTSMSTDRSQRREVMSPLQIKGPEAATRAAVGHKTHSCSAEEGAEMQTRSKFN